MLPRARRPVSSLCIALLALNVVACAHVKREDAQTVLQPGGGNVRRDKIVGVTLKDGREIPVDERSHPVVRAGSLQIVVAKQPLTIPVSDLREVWVRSIDRTRTTMLVAGLTFGVLAYLAAFTLSEPVVVF